jgi:hypothetical protein
VESASAYGDDDVAAQGGPAGQQEPSFSGRSNEWYKNYFQQEIKAETAARDFLALMLSLGWHVWQRWDTCTSMQTSQTQEAVSRHL